MLQSLCIGLKTFLGSLDVSRLLTYHSCSSFLASGARLWLRRMEELGSARLIEPQGALDIECQKGSATLSFRAEGSTCAREECSLGDIKGGQMNFKCVMISRSC